MSRNNRTWLALAAAALIATSLPLTASEATPWARGDKAKRLAESRRALEADLAALGLRLGSPIFIRIFKETAELEVWLRHDADGRWRLFRTYPICKYSGDLGPKLREGDGQSPEGLYRIRAGQLHPNSRYHLAFNLGFPNAFDRSLGRTGSYLMVHGDCVSIGCYAMTDRGIEEIYALAEAALQNGQAAFQVHAFPARLSEAWLSANESSPWIDFWRSLEPCYKSFETARVPPKPTIHEKRYVCT